MLGMVLRRARGRQGTPSSVPAQGKGDKNPPQSQGEGHNRDLRPEGMRSLSWSSGGAQAVPSLPILAAGQGSPLHRGSTCPGQSGAGIFNFLAGQSQPLCSHQLQKCLFPSVLGIRRCCRLISRVSVRDTFPALCIPPPLLPQFSPQALPSGLLVPNLEVPAAFPRRSLAPCEHNPVLLLPPALHPCPQRRFRATPSLQLQTKSR